VTTGLEADRRVHDADETASQRLSHRLEDIRPSALSTLRSLEGGYGAAIGHQGEILQGVFHDDGAVVRGLVTLPCRLFGSKAAFLADETGVVTVEPAWRVLSRRAAQLTLERCGRRGLGGHVTVQSNIPPSWGLGSSTTDVTATIRAVADALGVLVTAEEVAVLAVATEVASDSTMFEDRCILFAQRAGVVVEDLGGALPPLVVLGFNTHGAEEGGSIDTLAFAPARYDWAEIESFRPLLGLLRRAVQTQDAMLLGRVATASAAINERFLPQPGFERLLEIADEVGAVGLQVAHSGVVAGLLFRADERAERRLEAAAQLLRGLGIERTWRFGTREEGTR
jgi:uncharacterized protein involved in propanediol utilization